ncbi:DNA topoisomerase IB [Roseateles asaccharophilus]|uniref:DNA topoisomerase n=1 Tax=Roseateles asaccharophilus TaxID=582607 RepID=A0ABU2A267_9BURK|nr:DNA topoisomerase IB [Roseateles asaccharophilus]MDR7331271.1 DNA topoisomerase-1 [Roseateles asaccharophilus]
MTSSLAAPLRWSSDAQPGLARRPRRAGGFDYVDARGRRLRDAAQLARIQKLAVPPAWTDVWISPWADSHLQATGRDARGRKQYRYHADWQAQRGQRKFDGLRRFGRVLPRLRRRVQQVLAGPAEPTRERVLATLVRLLDTTWLRIGNASYARENGSYGLSTLRNRHAGVKGDAIQLSFVGKSGVRHSVTLTDRRVARIVRRCRELPGQELFRYVDENGDSRTVDSADVNAWLAEAAGERVTAKDFRTWHGSVLALQLTLQACSSSDPPCRPAQVVAQVAQRLGNTVAVCRKAYIHPRVLAASEFLQDAAAREALSGQRWARAPAARGGLSGAEHQLLALLRSRSAAGQALRLP